MNTGCITCKHASGGKEVPCKACMESGDFSEWEAEE